MRVHELAKQLSISAKEIMPLLDKEGITVKSHMSSIDEETAKNFLAKHSGTTSSQQTPSPTVKSPKKEKKVTTQKSSPKDKDSKPQKTPKKETKPAVADSPQEKDISSPLPESKDIYIGDEITVKELADLVHKPIAKLINELMNLGIMVTQNQSIDHETAAIVAHDFGFEILEQPAPDTPPVEEPEPEPEEEDLDDEADLVEKDPVITFMGHVDHGKTSLIDYIRKTKIADNETGSITQHIGAYEINFQNKRIVIIDTPGHKAFSTMRSRGANITDIAILVIAADDGIMEQTREAISHARAAKVPIIVALNKIDKATADIDKAFRQLSEVNLMTEDWGGEIICCKVSAITGEGIDHLLEMIQLQAEMLELKANPSAQCKGTVIESAMVRGRGPTATILITRGILKIGDPIICDSYHGKVKALLNDQGKNIREAGPATPVELLGLNGVPEAGSIVKVVSSDKEAKRIAQDNQTAQRTKILETTTKPTTLEELYTKIESEEMHELKLIIKGDVHGSVEALRQSLEELSTDKVSVSVIHVAVGDVSESDVTLACASGAVIIGFCTRIDKRAHDLAKHEGVQIKTFAIIYEAIDHVRLAMEGMLGDKELETFAGSAEVRETFSISKIGVIAGCYVLEGKVFKKAKIRVIRDNEVLFEGKIDSLKRFKDEAKEVKAGMECGIKIDHFNDIKIGDIFEFYAIERVAQTL